MRHNHLLKSSTGVASGGPLLLTHYVSEGDYELEFASLLTISADHAVWGTVRFEQDPSSADITRAELGAGYATEEIPLTIKGPIPFSGPGYFYLVMISHGATDYFTANLVYRRIIT